MESLLVEAGIRGVAVPLTAAAAGGLIGAALWFTRPDSKKDQHPGVVRAMLVGSPSPCWSCTWPSASSTSRTSRRC